MLVARVEQPNASGDDWRRPVIVVMGSGLIRRPSPSAGQLAALLSLSGAPDQRP